MYASTSLGLGAHQVFSQEILKNPPADIRFIFQVNDYAVKQGQVNPYEMQYLNEHFKGISIRSSDNFNSNIFIFDNSALITSATLTKAAFETNIEAGVLLEGTEAEEVKGFFNESLWNSAKSIGDLKKYKHNVELSAEEQRKTVISKKLSLTPKSRIGPTPTSTHGILAFPNGYLQNLSAKIKKETNWPTNLFSS